MGISHYNAFLGVFPSHKIILNKRWQNLFVRIEWVVEKPHGAINSLQLDSFSAIVSFFFITVVWSSWYKQLSASNKSFANLEMNAFVRYGLMISLVAIISIDAAAVVGKFSSFDFPPIREVVVEEIHLSPITAFDRTLH